MKSDLRQTEISKPWSNYVTLYSFLKKFHQQKYYHPIQWVTTLHMITLNVAIMKKCKQYSVHQRSLAVFVGISLIISLWWKGTILECQLLATLTKPLQTIDTSKLSKQLQAHETTRSSRNLFKITKLLQIHETLFTKLFKLPNLSENTKLSKLMKLLQAHETSWNL